MYKKKMKNKRAYPKQVYQSSILKIFMLEDRISIL